MSNTISMQLGYEWEQPDGFLARLRGGQFDPHGLDRLLQILQSLIRDNADCLDREIVALIWFIPLFMTWQRERVLENGTSATLYDSACHKVLNVLFEVLGTP